MVRIIVSLEQKDKLWLDRKARRDGVSTAEIVRQAVRQLKQSEEKSFEDLLAATRGVWRGGDGLRYQRKVRRDWDERSA